MKRSSIFRSAVFLSALSAALVLSPAGCAGSSTGTAQPGSTGQASDAATLFSAKNSFLPHPAFAYAQNNSANGVSIADIAERVMPSVVNISSSRVRRTDSTRQDPFFRHFFGPGEAPERRESGLGSGVIVSSDGIVLTNNHVVEADEIKVTTSDNREFTAQVLGADPKSDLAVIKLKGDTAGLKPIELGDSAQLRLGDVVLAIGNPFGVGQTVTMGIVSAKGRANMGIVDYEDFIQTDAAINPGNSGGALVNMEGKLVGINTAILSRTGGNMGIGFAIPTNMAKPIMDSLQKYGKVVRGWLGVSIQDVDQELAKALKLPSARGVLLGDVSAGGPADKAGLRRGDVVLKIDGKSVDSTGQLRNTIAAAGTGKRVELEIIRDGKPQKVSVALGEMPQPAGAAPGLPSSAPPGASLDGLTLESLSPSLRSRYKIPSSVAAGLVVTRIDPASPAARAGLRPGDVLLEVNRQKVDSVDRFKELYSKAKGPVLVLIEREGSSLFLVVRR